MCDVMFMNGSNFVNIIVYCINVYMYAYRGWPDLNHDLSIFESFYSYLWFTIVEMKK